MHKVAVIRWSFKTSDLLQKTGSKIGVKLLSTINKLSEIPEEGNGPWPNHFMKTVLTIMLYIEWQFSDTMFECLDHH